MKRTELTEGWDSLTLTIPFYFLPTIFLSEVFLIQFQNCKLSAQLLRFLRFLLCRNYFTEGNEDNEGLEQPILSLLIYLNLLAPAAIPFRKTFLIGFLFA